MTRAGNRRTTNNKDPDAVRQGQGGKRTARVVQQGFVVLRHH